jgi:hypothetical protein
VPAGHGLVSRIDDLEGSGVATVLRELADKSTFVIIRSRPADVASDAQFFGRHARAAIPVIEIGRTVRESVQNAVRQWNLVDTVVPGAVTVPPFDPPEQVSPHAAAASSWPVSVERPTSAPAPRMTIGSTDQNVPLGKASPTR